MCFRLLLYSRFTCSGVSYNSHVVATPVKPQSWPGHRRPFRAFTLWKLLETERWDPTSTQRWRINVLADQLYTDQLVSLKWIKDGLPVDLRSTSRQYINHPSPSSIYFYITFDDPDVRIHHRESFGQAVADLPNVFSELGKYKQPGIYPGICPDHLCVAS